MWHVTWKMPFKALIVDPSLLEARDYTVYKDLEPVLPHFEEGEVGAATMHGFELDVVRNMLRDFRGLTINSGQERRRRKRMFLKGLVRDKRSNAKLGRLMQVMVIHTVDLRSIRQTSRQLCGVLFYCGVPLCPSKMKLCLNMASIVVGVQPYTRPLQRAAKPFSWLFLLLC